MKKKLNEVTKLNEELLLRSFCKEAVPAIKKREKRKTGLAIGEDEEVCPAMERREKNESQKEENAGEERGKSETPKDQDWTTRTSLPVDENFMERLQRESLDFLSADDDLEEEDLANDLKLAGMI